MSRRSAENIPEPPREIRWRPCLGARWISGVLGTTFTALGVLVFVLVGVVGSGGSPFRDDAIDSDLATTRGEITSVEETGENWFGRVVELRFRYRVGSSDYEARSYTAEPTSAMRVGNTATVEFLRQKPELARLAGTLAVFFPFAVSLTVSLLLLPGVIWLYFWGKTALRLRVALREGRLTSAEILSAEPVRYVNPNPLLVRYRFLDAAGQSHEQGHWVSQKSTIGRRLLEGGVSEHPLIHDGDDPRVSRLVTAEDFDRGVAGP